MRFEHAVRSIATGAGHKVEKMSRCTNCCMTGGERVSGDRMRGRKYAAATAEQYVVLQTFDYRWRFRGGNFL